MIERWTAIAYRTDCLMLEKTLVTRQRPSRQPKIEWIFDRRWSSEMLLKSISMRCVLNQSKRRCTLFLLLLHWRASDRPAIIRAVAYAASERSAIADQQGLSSTSERSTMMLARTSWASEDLLAWTYGAWKGSRTVCAANKSTGQVKHSKPKNPGKLNLSECKEKVG